MRDIGGRVNLPNRAAYATAKAFVMDPAGQKLYLTFFNGLLIRNKMCQIAYMRQTPCNYQMRSDNMGLGDMLGKAVSSFGGTDAIVSKISESGLDMSALADMDVEGVTSMLESKGIDLSMLEGLGLSVDDVIEKIKAHIAG
jgi:hypothetical protein